MIGGAYGAKLPMLIGPPTCHGTGAISCGPLGVPWSASPGPGRRPLPGAMRKRGVRPRCALPCEDQEPEKHAHARREKSPRCALPCEDQEPEKHAHARTEKRQRSALPCDDQKAVKK